MYMAANEAVGERSHGVAEDISGYCLNNVFNKLRTVGFNALPFLGGSYAFIGDGLTAEQVLSDTRLHIA